MIGPKTLSLSLAIFSGAMLMVTSQIVQNLEHKKDLLRIEIQKEEQRMQFLETEWAYLNRPERLAKLAESLGVDEDLAHVPNIVAEGQAIPEPMVPIMPHRKPSHAMIKPGVALADFTSEKPVNEIEPAAGKVKKLQIDKFNNIISDLNSKNKDLD